MKKNLLFLLFVSFANTAYSASVFVENATGSGFSPAELEAATVLLRNGVSETKEHELTKDAKSADFVLSPKLLKLGSSVVVAVDKTKGEKVVFSTKMKAANMDELDTVSNRLVRAVMSEQTAKEAVTVADVTREEETSQNRRYQATRQWQFAFGPAWGANLRSSTGTLFNIGYVWGLEPKFDLRLVWDFYAGRDGSDAYMNNLAIGGDYYFSTAKHAPFVGADIGWANAKASDGCSTLNPFCTTLAQSRSSGWGIGANVGYRFFRTSNVNLAVILRYATILERNSEGNPGVTSVRLAVYY